jgi:hypothetical protein
VVGLGTTIPLVYALRETISGNSFGGVRVNTPLLWSQIWSLGSSQMLRAVFLLGEGRLDSIDTQGFAIGNNSLGVYDLLSNTANERASRLTVYHRDNGGRLSSGNRVSGRTPLWQQFRLQTQPNHPPCHPSTSQAKRLQGELHPSM